MADEAFGLIYEEHPEDENGQIIEIDPSAYEDDYNVPDGTPAIFGTLDEVVAEAHELECEGMASGTYQIGTFLLPHSPTVMPRPSPKRDEPRRCNNCGATCDKRRGINAGAKCKAWEPRRGRGK
jgi:hypothetical protein